jgi:restriction-modification enzyme MmeI-like protein
LPDHSGSALLLRSFGDCWAAFLVADSLVQDQPDQPTLSMGNRSNGLIMSQARDRAAIHNLEDASFGSGCGVGRLIEKAPEVAVALRRPVAIVHSCALVIAILHRPKKDPRELRILDPASGSGHFLLYCFDLLLTIYEEAYADPKLGPALQKDYPNLEDLRREVPRLILAHNLHGIDIDLRCAQIAALALWLRCQRAYQEMGLKKDRPPIKRSNFVCAEPMPGEEGLLKEFVSQLEMKLAGEAGSLLKIEEEIRDTVTVAKKQWVQ